MLNFIELMNIYINANFYSFYSIKTHEVIMEHEKFFTKEVWPKGQSGR